MQRTVPNGVSLRVGLPPAILLVVILAVLWIVGVPPAAAQSADRGADVYEAKCAACHTIGGGPLVGPDLEGVSERRDPEWLARWIAEPDAMLAEGDPIAVEMLAEFNDVPMPNLDLADAEVQALVAYLESLSGAAAPVAPEPVKAAAGPFKPDSGTGKALFEGTNRFDNGGPPCLACHSIAGIGALGGGALGPDLTGAYGKFGADGIVSVLATTPFQTMKPIFDDQPLTPEEQAHLAEFLSRAAVSKRTAASVGQLALLGLVGAVFLLLVMQFLWRRRLREVRRPMVARSRERIERAKQAQEEQRYATPGTESR
ncbi:MAG: cytochrome c [Acidimicrobiales bacterium]|nr:cytochrome c [Acidimicrobiales bacterium]MDP6696707.1 cytochrome c [Acidimicrobiales bacterium]